MSLSYEDIFGDQHREVIHDQTCKDFLYHAVLFLWMESNKTNMVFQFSEWGFNTPAHFRDHLNIFSREFIIPKIGNKSFIIIFRYLDPYDPEFQWIGIFWAIREKVKNDLRIKKPVFIRIRFNFISLSSCKQNNIFDYGKLYISVAASGLGLNSILALNQAQNNWQQHIKY